jgi:hypothetical protein
MARAYLQEANLPKKFWFWAIRTAFERMNMIPMEVGEDSEGKQRLSTPFELFYGQQPDLRTLFPFGCVGYFKRETDHLSGTPHHRTKFQAQTYPGIALGRSNNSNGLIFWSPEQQRFSVSADYRLDTDKQVRNHWPELLNDGGFVLHLMDPALEPSKFNVDDKVLFYTQGPETATGDRPIVSGLVASTPIPDQVTTYRIKLEDNTYADVCPDDLIHPEDCEYDIDENDPIQKDPTDGDPIHPEHPTWLVIGQPVACYRLGQCLLGYLDLDSGFLMGIRPTRQLWNPRN